MSIKTIEYFIEEAISLAVENVKNGIGGPFGAVIVKNGEIIAKGTNKVTSINDPTAHAEIVAIREACSQLQSFQLVGCDIYCSCEPCPMCLGAIYWARPDRIFFAASKHDAASAGFDDSFIYDEMHVEHDNRTIPTKKIYSGSYQNPFKEWNSYSDKIKY